MNFFKGLGREIIGKEIGKDDLILKDIESALDAIPVDEYVLYYIEATESIRQYLETSLFYSVSQHSNRILLFGVMVRYIDAPHEGFDIKPKTVDIVKEEIAEVKRRYDKRISIIRRDYYEELSRLKRDCGRDLVNLEATLEFLEESKS